MATKCQPKLVGWAANAVGLKINIGKNKNNGHWTKDIENQITADATRIQNMEQFEYLDRLITWDSITAVHR